MVQDFPDEYFFHTLASRKNKGYTIEKALWFASITASLSLSKKGGSSSIPTLSDVLNVYNKEKEEITIY